MSRRHTQSTEGPGQDSFLDIVANIVGILIILVMVVGVKAKDAFIAAPPPPPVATTKTAQPLDLEAATSEALSLKAEIEDKVASAQKLRQQVMSRFQERNQMQALVTQGEHLIEEEKKKLNGRQREEFELRQQLQASHEELEDLVASRIAVENQTTPVQVIRHLPTPMAKTVFGEEEHFRLKDGRLCYVPMNDFVKQFREEAKLKTYKLEDTPRITETIGPREGFQFQYTLIRTQRAVELDNFIMIPVSNELGEPLAAALQEGSAFMNRLRRFDPNSTTITIWTYPDSFSDFRDVKAALYERGYLTAGRPMPAGQPIGGSPHGQRSAAE